MARRRRKRRMTNKISKRTTPRNKAIKEGNLIIRDTVDDKAAAQSLAELLGTDDVLDATDLHESFRYFSTKHNTGGKK